MSGDIIPFSADPEVRKQGRWRDKLKGWSRVDKAICKCGSSEFNFVRLVKEHNRHEKTVKYSPMCVECNAILTDGIRDVEFKTHPNWESYFDEGDWLALGLDQTSMVRKCHSRQSWAPHPVADLRSDHILIAQTAGYAFGANTDPVRS